MSTFEVQVADKEINFLRQAGWVTPEYLSDVFTIIGCGATGSRVAVEAARMGFTKFSLWDADKVESHNLPNQAFFHRHIGLPKAQALADLLLEINPNIKVSFYNEFFTEESKIENCGPVFIAVDSLSARKYIAKTLTMNENVTFVVETAIGFHHGSMNILNPLDYNQMEAYINNLPDDKDVPDGPCNLRTCGTFVGFIADYLVHRMCEISIELYKDPLKSIDSETIHFQLNGGNTVVLKTKR